MTVVKDIAVCSRARARVCRPLCLYGGVYMCLWIRGRSALPVLWLTWHPEVKGGLHKYKSYNTSSKLLGDLRQYSKRKLWLVASLFCCVTY